jgi:hypothetical protein
MRLPIGFLSACFGLTLLPGCGGSDTALPPVPTVDNRPAETKEADDGMAKNAAKVNAAAKH